MSAYTTIENITSGSILLELPGLLFSLRYLVHAVEEVLPLRESLTTGIPVVREVDPGSHTVAPLSLLWLFYTTSRENRGVNQ